MFDIFNKKKIKDLSDYINYLENELDQLESELLEYQIKDNKNKGKFVVVKPDTAFRSILDIAKSTAKRGRGRPKGSKKK
jgi:uncharacterized protein Yka (UPF0111/DUF47 family)